MVTSGVGEALRRERMRRQLSLEDVSAVTKISARFLKAIEAEDFGKLPGLLFARNFVRQYASFLNLDSGPLVAMLPRVDVESTPMPQPPQRPHRALWDPRWNSTFASVAWTVLAGGAAVGTYIHYNRPATADAISTVHAARPQAPAATVTPVAAARAPVAEPSHAVDVVPGVLPAPADTSSPNHPVQVVITARKDAWVQAIADDKSLFATLLKAGETRPVGADKWVKIRTGNAGGVEISLNGKMIDALGPEGQVRSVMLTADGPRPVPVAPVPQTPRPETSPL